MTDLELVLAAASTELGTFLIFSVVCLALLVGGYINECLKPKNNQ